MKKFVVLSLFLILKFTLSAQWILTNPVTTSVFKIIEKENKLFAAGYGGLFVSTNDGASWAKVTSKTPPKMYSQKDVINNLMLDNNTLYITGSFNGIYKSTDEGINWTLVNPIYNNVLDVRKNDVFCKGSKEFFYSSDTGKTWKDITKNLSSTLFSNVTQLAKTGSSVHLMYEGKLFKTDNYGITWDTNTVIKDSIYYLCRDSSKLIALTKNNIYQSTDNGINWTKNILPEENPSTISAFGSMQFLYFENTRTIYKSSSSGLFWEKLPIERSVFWSTPHGGNYLTQYNKKLILNKKGYLIATSSFGVSVSKDNGLFWLPALNSSFYPTGCIYINKFRENIIGTFWEKSCVSTDNTSTWNEIFDFISIRDIEDLGNLTVLSSSEGLYKTNQIGKVWEKINFPFSVLKYGGALYFNNQNLFLAQGGVFVSKDTGTTWLKTQSLGLPTNKIFYDLEGNRNRLFVYDKFSGDYYYSDDLGASWKNKTLSTTEIIDKIFCQNDTIIAATYNNVFISFDSGENWKTITNGLVNKQVNDVILYKGRVVICGFNYNLQISDKDFTRWDEIDSDSYTLYRNSKLMVKDDYLWLADDVEGLFKKRLIDIEKVDNKEINNQQIELKPNPTTDILYVNTIIDKTIDIYNINGLKVKTVNNCNGILSMKELTPGAYFINIRDQNTSNFYKIIKL